MTVFLVPAAAVALVAAAFLIAGWAINRPDTGRRAKPLSIEDQRTIRWAKALNPKNVHGAGETEAAAKAASGPASADRPAGPVRSNVSRPGSAAEQLPVANEGHTGPGHHFEACDGCTVMGCGSGCKCACHWGTPGPVVVRADAWYDPAFDFDFAGLLDRADAVLAGATC